MAEAATLLNMPLNDVRRGMLEDEFDPPIGRWEPGRTGNRYFIYREWLDDYLKKKRRGGSCTSALVVQNLRRREVKNTMTEMEYLKEQEKLLELSIKTGRDSLRFSRERLAVIRRLISHMEGQPDGTGCPTDREGSEVTES